MARFNFNILSDWPRSLASFMLAGEGRVATWYIIKNTRILMPFDYRLLPIPFKINWHRCTSPRSIWTGTTHLCRRYRWDKFSSRIFALSILNFIIPHVEKLNEAFPFKDAMVPYETWSSDTTTSVKRSQIGLSETAMTFTIFRPYEISYTYLGDPLPIWDIPEYLDPEKHQYRPFKM